MNSDPFDVSSSCPGNNGLSRRRNEGGSCTDPDAPPIIPPIVPNLLPSENDQDKITPETDPQTTDPDGQRWGGSGGAMWCDETFGISYISRKWEVCCRGSLGPFHVDINSRVIFKYITDCNTCASIIDFPVRITQAD